MDKIKAKYNVGCRVMYRDMFGNAKPIQINEVSWDEAECTYKYSGSSYNGGPVSRNIPEHDIIAPYTLVLNKNLMEFLSKWPADAEVIADGCNITNMRYDPEKNVIFISGI